jgi:hypothetical protein
MLKRQFQVIYNCYDCFWSLPELSSRTNVDIALVTESAATSRSLRRLRPLLFVPTAELLPEPARDDEDVPKHIGQYF